MAYALLFWLSFMALYFMPESIALIQVKSVVLNLTVDTHEDREASFGLDLDDVDEIMGYLVVVYPVEGCSKLAPPPAVSRHEISSNERASTPTPLHSAPSTFERVSRVVRAAAESFLYNGKAHLHSADVLLKGGNGSLTLSHPYPMFALIRRGNCSFVNKVRMAQAANYSAVIVYDNVSESGLVAMGPGTENVSDITIPSVFVSYEDGEELKEFDFITSRHRYYIVITSTFSLPFTFYLVPFFVVVIVGLLAMVGGFLLKMCLDWRTSRRNRLSRRHLKKLTEKKFQKGVDPYETCAICLEDYEDGDKIRILPCAHAFHSNKCIDPWLLKNKRNCPICKRRIRIHNVPDDSADEENNEGVTSSTAPTEEQSYAVEAEERRPLLQNGVLEQGSSVHMDSSVLEHQHNAGYGSTDVNDASVVHVSGPSMVERLSQRLTKLRNTMGGWRVFNNNPSPGREGSSTISGNINTDILESNSHANETLASGHIPSSHNHIVQAHVHKSSPVVPIAATEITSQTSSLDGELFYSFQQRTLTPTPIIGRGSNEA